MDMMMYVPGGHYYTGKLPDGRTIKVEADHFQACLHQDEELDDPLFRPQQWLEAMNEQTREVISMVSPPAGELTMEISTRCRCGFIHSQGKGYLVFSQRFADYAGVPCPSCGGEGWYMTARLRGEQKEK